LTGRTLAISGFPRGADNPLGGRDAGGKLRGGNLLESDTNYGSNWKCWTDHLVRTNWRVP